MKKILLTCAFALLASSTYASEPANNSTLEANPPVSASRIPRLATLAEGDLADGDLMMISRGFGSWAMRCEWLLSKSKRVCGIEQRTYNDHSDVSWRVAQTVDEKPVLMISVPKHFDASKGMQLSFSGLEKTIPANEWTCNDRICITSIEFDGFIQAAITNSSEVRFHYSIVSNDEHSHEIELSGPMDGFKRALKAASADPFGREVLASTQDAKRPQVKTVKPVVKARETKRTVSTVPYEAKSDTHTEQPSLKSQFLKSRGLF
ncbi:invasion associated locus B family protein [Brucella pseudogrignonensis]|uniref:invasion associated locus B family protein n=1 Tax=Brucella pseudogrignonensis TaxID=419475 RepID=UPI0038D213E0